MVEADITPFVAMLRDVHGLYPSAKPLSDGQAAMFFRAVAAYPLATVQQAFDAHVKDAQRGRFPPLPADVIAQIDGQAAADGRPGADEAWATALKARDEAASLVWTEETAQAWSLARTVLQLGDEVGARMAFREAYNRLVDDARRQCRPIEWVASLGFDPAGRAAAIEAAQVAGLLADAPTLALPMGDSATGLFGAMPPHIRERLTALADRLRAASDAPSVDAMARAETQQRQAETAGRVAAYVGGLEESEMTGDLGSTRPIDRDLLAADPRFAQWVAGQ